MGPVASCREEVSLALLNKLPGFVFQQVALLQEFHHGRIGMCGDFGNTADLVETQDKFIYSDELAIHIGMIGNARHYSNCSASGSGPP